ncbi:zinc finger protein 414 isoform 2-T2 [Polymixia lowei]
MGKKETGGKHAHYTAASVLTPTRTRWTVTSRTMRSLQTLFQILLCSTIGCSGSFPSMQKLMEHMRQHHKPNLFFLCESCRAKLRSYRGLLTHLHTCSKLPRSKLKTAEPMHIQPTPATKPSTSPTASEPFSTDQHTPQQDAVSTPLQVSSQMSFPTGLSVPDAAATSFLNPPCMSNQEHVSPQVSLQQLTEADSKSHLQTEASNPSSSLNLDAQPVTTDPLQPQARCEPQRQPQPQTKSLQPVLPAPVSSPQSPPGSTAVWRKNQGLSCNSRILWEHTRGRYRCVQCGHSVANRREMTAHINTHHRGPPASKPTGDTGGPVANT